MTRADLGAVAWLVVAALFFGGVLYFAAGGA